MPWHPPRHFACSIVLLHRNLSLSDVAGGAHRRAVGIALAGRLGDRCCRHRVREGGKAVAVGFEPTVLQHRHKAAECRGTRLPILLVAIVLLHRNLSLGGVAGSRRSRRRAVGIALGGRLVNGCCRHRVGGGVDTVACSVQITVLLDRHRAAECRGTRPAILRVAIVLLHRNLSLSDVAGGAHRRAVGIALAGRLGDRCCRHRVREGGKAVAVGFEPTVLQHRHKAAECRGTRLPILRVAIVLLHRNPEFGWRCRFPSKSPSPRWYCSGWPFG